MSQGRNTPCLCGSGRKYKKCCGGVHADKPLLPQSAYAHSVQEDAKLEHCMHPEASEEQCGKIINAHTIQRARTLKELVSENNKVLSFFHSRRQPGQVLEPVEVGWRQASTFTGFCDKHDGATFSPVELKPFTFTAENSFLLMYRALCLEAHKKKTGAHALALNLEMSLKCIDPGSRWGARRLHGSLLRGFSKAQNDLEVLKRKADTSLLNHDYTEWAFACIQFEGQLCLSSAGATTPNVDFDGQCIQMLPDAGVSVQPLFMNIVSTPSGCAIVLGWLREHDAPWLWLKSILKRADVADCLVQYAFAYNENTFFSARWWAGLSQQQREQLTHLAGIEPYGGSPPKYRHNGYVPWRLLDVATRGLPFQCHIGN